jgi:hypothetical protein
MTAAPAAKSAPVPFSAVQAIAAVMRELGPIGKNDRAPANMGGYTYRGIEAITGQLQPLLAKHGLIIVPQVASYDVVPAPGQKEAWQDVYLTVRWLVYGPDGSHVEAVTQGVGRDHTDKGANKAQTQAFKYLLMALFCIADAKDDGDGHALSGSARIEAPVDTELIKAATAATVLYARLLQLRGTTAAEAVKALAERHGRGLREVDLRDREWRDLVEIELDNAESYPESLLDEVAP